MENENVKDLIKAINEMNIKDKLRLVICMTQDKWGGLKYNTKENYEKFRNMLKMIDEEYRTTNINMAKYFNIMFFETKLMVLPPERQNQIILLKIKDYIDFIFLRKVTYFKKTVKDV